MHDFLAHLNTTEKNEYFQWTLVKAHRDKEPDTIESFDTGLKKISMKIYSKRASTHTPLSHTRRNILSFRGAVPEALSSSIEAQSAINIVECWLYSDEQPPYETKSTIMDHDVKDWLQKERPNRNNIKPLAGLRLIQRQQHQVPGVIPFTEEAFTAINNTFCLLPVHDHLMSDTSGFLGRVSGTEGEMGESHQSHHTDFGTRI